MICTDSSFSASLYALDANTAARTKSIRPTGARAATLPHGGLHATIIHADKHESLKSFSIVHFTGRLPQ